MADQTLRIARLSRLLEVSRNLAATTDLDALLRQIIQAACDVLDCERASIFLYDNQTDELCARVATGVDEIRFPASAGIAGAAAQSRAIVNVPHAYADQRFNRDVDKKTGFRTRNILSFPLLNLAGELVGVLQALNKRTDAFDSDDEELAEVLGGQVGVALHRQRLLEEQTVKQRLARDLEVAREIQQVLFPKQDPHVDGYDIAGWNRSADETGGDCYDFLTLPDGRLAILLADATGHGIGAALIIAQFRSLLRALLSVTQDLPTIVARVNDLLADDTADDRFVTAFIGILDPAAGALDYVAAGQGPLLVLDSAGVKTRGASALPLAVMPGERFDADRIELKPGGLCALLTDGFYEAADGNGALFGEERVAACLLKPHESARAAIQALEAEVGTFVDDAPQADDLTAVLIRRI